MIRIAGLNFKKFGPETPADREAEAVSENIRPIVIAWRAKMDSSGVPLEGKLGELLDELDKKCFSGVAPDVIRRIGWPKLFFDISNALSSASGGHPLGDREDTQLEDLVKDYFRDKYKQ